MQNKYVGDIGDYAKYGLLRALGAKRRLGVAWYLFPDEVHNADGKHTSYLHDMSDKWRSCDPELFDSLKKIVCCGRRSIEAIEQAGVLPQATTYSGKNLDPYLMDWRLREDWRKQWFQKTLQDLQHCDIVFADPDNGLYEDEKFNPSAMEHWKRISLNEALALAQGRTAIIYHHNTRRAGGHEEEIKYWQRELGEGTLALRWRAGSARTFFVVNPSADMPQELADFARNWGSKAEFVPAI